MTEQNTQHPDLSAPLLDIIAQHPEGIRFKAIRQQFSAIIGSRAIKYRLRVLCDRGRIKKRGSGSGTSYFPRSAIDPDLGIVLSADSLQLLKDLDKPLSARAASRFDATIIEAYRPNETAWFSVQEKHSLSTMASSVGRNRQRPGTCAQQIKGRVIIDLSWNSSRLDGGLYSLLDARRLIVFGESSPTGSDSETQLLLNHRDAIEFLVEQSEQIAFDRHTLQNLHGLLANNLLADCQSPGRLRNTRVRIPGSTYSPCDVAAQTEHYLDVLLNKCAMVEDPFEQALMVLAYLAYLHPFNEANNSVSRLAANIPFFKAELVPLLFVDVPTDLYEQALLGFYELNEICLLKELFIWAYENSVKHYAPVVHKSTGPDPFRMRHRDALQKLIQEMVVCAVPADESAQHIHRWTNLNVPADDRMQFNTVAELELQSLHDGSLARYKIQRAEFSQWQQVQKSRVVTSADAIASQCKE